MIDKKKIVQRLNKESKLKEFPLLNLYIIVAALLQVIGELFKIYYLQIIKPLPIVLMIVYLHGKNSMRQHLVPSLIEIGLILSLFGDLLLMPKQISSFMIGTGFFTVAHIVYIVAFCIGQQIRETQKKYSVLRKIAYLLICSLLFLNIFTLWDLFPNRLLFTVYGTVLAAQAIVTLSRYEHTTPSSFYFTLIGVVLFSISDNLLGFLKFNHIKTDLGRGVIMLTYYSAQYFIMHGSLHQSNLQEEISRYFKNRGRTY